MIYDCILKWCLSVHLKNPNEIKRKENTLAIENVFNVLEHLFILDIGDIDYLL